MGKIYRRKDYGVNAAAIGLFTGQFGVVVILFVCFVFTAVMKFDKLNYGYIFILLAVVIVMQQKFR